jgi:hypothetical protein
MIIPEKVIERVDEVRPNTVDIKTKKEWLKTADNMIYQTVVLRHCGWNFMKPYQNARRDKCDPPEPMMIDEPWGMPVYMNYVISMIDQTNGDTARYNNDSILYNNALNDWAKEYHRTHMPLPAPRFRV